ncbi:ABC transporter ATP-binding protein [Heyndrickxia sporothermodurans]|uniref:ABC transporter ATP-binding protein n=1 Tax=Heyndrickxia sporothermodurans TaxID=46224 RepID=A0AB37HFV4_9BACI|nr:energy-coupling factor transporter ATPase [Heyndrickxia sporothermodurans]MBL5767886.1 ABC transporter ATP-binding protein [Heyndrickxia sporothermodurans]MBL5771486.1 ABC transporter ATP-binding protein [Heyndrickxia sporothermodurans]MBL5775143.1 ABC transporter ATP-binding protein [Heyndrickxia sporothermodurans]MBL5778590.1 ABC transporter ATP-binding protein [Heyndrickxia sporothermodurans]MBL5782161.1 ABC transporter ATP-binding protein [Heyndrickxia sporothermodurans]
MNTVIDIQNVTFTYPSETKPVLQNIDVKVEQGEFLAIIGGNGSGKSTLCKLMNGLIPHYYTGDFAGSAAVHGLNVVTSSVAELSGHVGYVYQDFENQLVQARVLEDAAFAPLHYGFEDYKERAREALQLVELDHLENEFVWQLSGGQKHLLALAGCLALNPDIIVLDEPIAQLDPFHAKKMYTILKKLHEQHQKTIIVIEHHTEFIADYCTSVLLLDKGQSVWKKPVKEALTSVDELTKRHIYPPQVTQATYTLGDTASLPITLDEAELHFASKVQRKRPQFIQRKIDNQGEPVASFQNVAFSYKTVDRSYNHILQNINLSFYKGEKVAIVGNNGAGKSTLMRLMTGFRKPASGVVKVMGNETTRQSPEQLADQVTYIYQNPEQMFIEDSVRKDVEFFLKARKRKGYKEKVDHILELFNLTDLQHKDSRLMSGGQQRRASLAIGAAMDPSIILLDEPTANLDIATRKHLTQFINQLEHHTELVMIATHDMQLVSEWSTRVIVMNNGEVIYDGNKEGLFSNLPLMRRAGIIPPQIVELSHMLHLSPAAYSIDSFVEIFQEEQIWTLQKA